MRQTEERMREDSADEVKKLVQKHKMEISIAKQFQQILHFTRYPKSGVEIQYARPHDLKKFKASW